MTQVILHANETGTVKSDQPSSIDLAMLRAGHWSGLVRNAYFVLEDGPAEVVPAGARIDSATFYFQSDDGGGYTATLAGLIIFCDNTGRDFYETSWNNPLPAYGSSTAVSIYGVNNNYRSVSLTARVQALIDNAKTGVRTLKLYRNPNTNTGTYDGKYFDLTHSDHYLVINYTEPPAAPTIGAAERVSDTQATIGWTNAVTGGPYASINILRSTDGGDYVQIASGLAASATSYTDSTISLNHYYAYKAVGVNTAGSATSDASNTLYTTPAAPSTLVATKTASTTVQLDWIDNANSEEYFELDKSTDGGANWSSVTATIAAGLTTYTDSSAPAGTVKYRLRAKRGTLYSAYAESNSVTTLCAPAAPTLTAWPAYSPTGTVLRIYIQHNTLDGFAQTKIYVTYTKDGVETTYEYTGTNAYYDIDITGLAATKVVTVKAKTKGAHADYGPDSAIQSTTLADTPESAITTPATDEAVVSDLPLVASWSVTDEYPLAYWCLHLWKGATLVHTWTGTTETSQSIGSTYLDDDSDYSLDLLVRTGSGRESALIERTFETDYNAPTVPAASAEFDADTLAVSVMAQAGETGALPATDHLELERIDSYEGVTTAEIVTDALSESSVYVDPLPRLGQDVTYRIRAVAANGAYSYVDVVVDTTGHSAALNFGAGYATMLPLKWDGQESHDSEDDSVSHVFAGRPQPVLYSGEHVFEDFRASAMLAEDADRTTLRELRAWHGPWVYRGAFGSRVNVKVGRIGGSRNAEESEMSVVSLDLSGVE